MTDTVRNRLETLEAGTFSSINASGSLAVMGNAEAASFEIASKGTWKIATVSLTAAHLGGTETATGFTFPAAGAIVLGAWLQVTDAESGTVDIGTEDTSNDPDGLLDGASVATLGYVGSPTTPALTGKFVAGGDSVTVTASGDLNSCAATLFISYFELPTIA